MEVFEFRAQIGSNGTLTIPLKIRQKLNLAPGNIFRFLIFKDRNPMDKSKSTNPKTAVAMAAVQAYIMIANS